MESVYGYDEDYLYGRVFGNKQQMIFACEKFNIRVYSSSELDKIEIFIDGNYSLLSDLKLNSFSGYHARLYYKYHEDYTHVGFDEQYAITDAKLEGATKLFKRKCITCKTLKKVGYLSRQLNTIKGVIIGKVNWYYCEECGDNIHEYQSELLDS